MHGKSYVLKKAKRLDIWSRGSISLAALTMRMYLPFNIYLPLWFLRSPARHMLIHFSPFLVRTLFQNKEKKCFKSETFLLFEPYHYPKFYVTKSGWAWKHTPFVPTNYKMSCFFRYIALLCF